MTNLESTGGDEPIKGGTSTKVDNTPLWQANNTYIRDKKNLYNQRLTEFVTDAFTFSQTLPKVKGKPVNSLDELPTLMDQYGNELYEQAKQVKGNPDLNDDQAKILLTRQKKVDDAFGYLAQANKIVSDDLLNAAKHMDGKMQVSGWHTLLLNQQGQLKGASQARKDIDAYRQKKIAEEMDAWRKANPISQSAPTYWQRTDMPNPVGNRIIQNPDGSYQTLDTRPKLANSKEGNMMMEGMQLELITRKYKNLNYDDAMKRLLQEYNKNPKSRKIKASEEGVFNDNGGGAKTALDKKEFRFDVDNFVDEDDEGNVSLNPEMEYAVDLFKNVVDNPNVRVIQGNFDNNSSIPESSDPASQKMLKAFYDDLQNTMLNIERSKGSNKRPTGTISFVPVAGGDENYHAYHLQLPSAYFDNHVGSKDNPGIARGQKMINEGITVFVPVAESQKIKIGRESIKGTTISPVEGMIALSGDNSFTRTMDDAMEYKITLDRKSNQYVVTGNAVAYNPETAKMDTVPINELGLKSRYDLSVDLDQLDKDLFKLGLKNFQINRERKREHSKLQGVRNPNQLSGN